MRLEPCGPVLPCCDPSRHRAARGSPRDEVRVRDRGGRGRASSPVSETSGKAGVPFSVSPNGERSAGRAPRGLRPLATLAIGGPRALRGRAGLRSRLRPLALHPATPIVGAPHPVPLVTPHGAPFDGSDNYPADYSQVIFENISCGRRKKTARGTLKPPRASAIAGLEGALPGSVPVVGLELVLGRGRLLAAVAQGGRHRRNPDLAVAAVEAVFLPLGVLSLLRFL
jgi:hypothetical protein